MAASASLARDSCSGFITSDISTEPSIVIYVLGRSAQYIQMCQIFNSKCSTNIIKGTRTNGALKRNEKILNLNNEIGICSKKHTAKFLAVYFYDY